MSGDLRGARLQPPLNSQIRPESLTGDIPEAEAAFIRARSPARNRRHTASEQNRSHIENHTIHKPLIKRLAECPPSALDQNLLDTLPAEILQDF